MQMNYAYRSNLAILYIYPVEFTCIHVCGLYVYKPHTHIHHTNIIPLIHTNIYTTALAHLTGLTPVADPQ